MYTSHSWIVFKFEDLRKAGFSAANLRTFLGVSDSLSCLVVCAAVLFQSPLIHSSSCSRKIWSNSDEGRIGEEPRNWPTIVWLPQCLVICSIWNLAPRITLQLDSCIPWFPWGAFWWGNLVMLCDLTSSWSAQDCLTVQICSSWVLKTVLRLLLVKDWLSLLKLYHNLGDQSQHLPNELLPYFVSCLGAYMILIKIHVSLSWSSFEGFPAADKYLWK